MRTHVFSLRCSRIPRTILGCLILGLVLLSRQGNAGEIPFSPRKTVVSNFDGAYFVHTADMDGDGDLDILGVAAYADDITWWENVSGDGSLWTTHVIDGDFDGAASVYAVDMDGDGDMDVVGAAQVADEIAWWENADGAGTVWTEFIVDTNVDHVEIIHPVDIDGDGDLDIVGAVRYDHDIAWWENTTGDGVVWTFHLVDGEFGGARSVFAADVDGDGDPDVLGAAVDADDITWWENAGDGMSWTEHIVDGNFDGAYSVYAADVDGDGDLDVLGAAFVANDVTWWENTNSDGSAWTEHVVDGDFNEAESVYAADLDADGDMDVLGAGDASGVSWWENTNGDGTVWLSHTIEADFSGAISVCAADLDGDSDLDVLSAAEKANTIAWWENQLLLPALVDLAPDTLNIKSHGQWVTAYITLPDGYNVADIDVTTLAITELIGESCPSGYNQPADLSFVPQVGDWDEDGVWDLTVKFDRQELILYLCLDDIAVTIEGDLTTGVHFIGTDMIRVIDRGK